jgi:hypothetical protein
MTVNGFPGSRLRARLCPDAPAVDGLVPGVWHDVFGGEAGRSGLADTVLVRPAAVRAGDAASYVPVSRSLIELGASDGTRRLIDPNGRRWLAALVDNLADGSAPRLRMVCQDGRYVLISPMAAATLDVFSDRELLGLLDASTRNGHPPSGVRREARVKPAFAWGYRMLDPDTWYLVDPRWTTDRALVLVTVEGDRVVDVGHFEVQTFLD